MPSTNTSMLVICLTVKLLVAPVGPHHGMAAIHSFMLHLQQQSACSYGWGRGAVVILFPDLRPAAGDEAPTNEHCYPCAATATTLISQAAQTSPTCLT